ncbi:MAG: GGDEF domain-containing protein [Thermochromatium sp.]
MTTRPTVPPDHVSEFLNQARVTLTYALQPIVNIHTGSVFGYEALLRGWKQWGFASICALFDQAKRWNISAALDELLGPQALGLFAALPNARRYRLFLNLDPHRIDPDHGQQVHAWLQPLGLRPDNLCLELSKYVDQTVHPSLGAMITGYRRHLLQIAIDDFGDGHSGLCRLYEYSPNYIKLARFLIQGIDKDPRKRAIVANTVQLAHQLNVQVIAKGIETEGELMTCHEIGCDLAQGHLIARPQLDPDALISDYTLVAEIHQRNQRELPGDLGLIESFLESIPPIRISDGIMKLFEALRRDKQHHLVPVVDEADRPLGLVHESDIKDYIYSTYGRDLIVNRAFARQVCDFVRPCSFVDIHDPIDRLLEAYSAASDTAGILVTRNGRYQGFISATSLLKLIEQKKLAVARDQNPLTKLPGNNPIHRYVSRAVSERNHTWHLAYIDFDNFKAFNDYYGFRRGDRAIQLFADLLRAELEQYGWFIGHVGGDDFFAGIQDASLPAVLERLGRLAEKFRIDVQSLYDPEDRQRGYLQAKDRYGQLREMPLMRCSLALLEIRPGDDYSDGDELGRTIAALKHAAKQSASGLVLQREPNGPAHVIPTVGIEQLPDMQNVVGPRRPDASLTGAATGLLARNQSVG